MKVFFRVLGAPPLLMVLTWTLLLIGYLTGPIDYFREPTLTTFALIGGGVLAYALASMLAMGLPCRTLKSADAGQTDRVIIVTGLIGIAGIVCLAVDKILLSGLDYTQGLAAVRFLRDSQVAAGVDVQRSVLLYVGYVTFSAAIIATLLLVLRAERVGRPAAIIAQVAVVSPIVYALLYGGRSPILLLCALIAAAAMVRAMSGLPILARTHGLRFKVLFLFVAFFAYVNMTWQDRREFTQAENYDTFVTNAADGWKLKPAAWLDDAVRRGDVDPNTAMDAVSMTLYATHSVGSIDKIVESSATFSPFLGIFQVSVLSPILRVFFPQSDILGRMNQELVDADLFGWFVSAWGALYLDFGLGGAVVAVLAWGFFAGRAYGSYAANNDEVSALLLTFWLASIMISPLSSPIGMSNSFQILVTIIVTIPFLVGRPILH